MKQKTLVVVDVQNEFCHPDGFFARNKLTCNPEGFFGEGKLNVKSIDNAVDNTESAIAHFRKEGLPIAYVRGVGDPQYLSDSRFERYKQMYEQGFLKDGTISTDFYRIKPLREEPVFTKGGLDAFSNTQFREYVQRTASGLILVGFFTDVCIDAIAMGAEEKGIGVPTEIIADCTASLYWPQDRQLEKLKMLYGTKIHNSLSHYVSNNQDSSS